MSTLTEELMLEVAALALVLSTARPVDPAEAAPSGGSKARANVFLPPVAGWSGKSRSLAAAASDPWATPSERSGLTETPRYDETVAWLERLVAEAPELHLVSLGKSPEGRDLWLVVASRERAFTPEALRATGKPTVFAQAGIHAGEIDGKDAGLMLLRDLTVGKRAADLLERANFLFLPIFNVDGHERFSEFTRVNQRGPREAGWRTTARNLNLNRDYTKLDAPETRLVVRALNVWPVDLYLDLHVTDDTDHQYDITYGHNWPRGWSPAIGAWIEGTLLPGLDHDLRAMDHVPGRFVQLVDALDPAKGLLPWFAGPRFSTGYADARHLPTLLVENHSLKPFARRVLGTRVFLESALRLLGQRGPSLRVAVAEDQARRPDALPLDFTAPAQPTRTLELQAVEWRSVPSPVSGQKRVEYTGRPVTARVPKFDATEPIAVTPRPAAYYVPAAWNDVIERLEVHGVRVERLDAPRRVEVDMYRLRDAKLASTPFEGRVIVTATPAIERRTETFPIGSVRVPTDQPLGDLAMLLLEPASIDSFFSWGFFHEALQPTEYVEAYIMDPMGERMLRDDPGLKQEFDRALSDPALAAKPRARLQWLYARTPYYDDRAFLYPVARERR